MWYYKAKHLLLFLPVLAIIIGFTFWLNTENMVPIQNEDIPYIKYKNQVVKIKIADELDEWRQGLSNRKQLAAKTGLLFVFPAKQERSFWMKDMLFPIDIVWLDDNKIIKIDKNLPPAGSEPKINYPSGTPINYVLEINAGFADELGMAIGDRLEYFFK